MNVLNDFRTNMKQIANGELSKGAVLKACDQLRDSVLPPFGF